MHDVWVGLDVGERRIGVAKSDALGITAQPYGYVSRTGDKSAIQELLQLAQQWDAVGFVIGLPLRTDGSRGPEVDTVERFVRKLRAASKLDIEWIDERFTTVMAHQALRAQGIKGDVRRHRVDQIAASLILQSFLDRGQHSEPR